MSECLQRRKCVCGFGVSFFLSLFPANIKSYGADVAAAVQPAPSKSFCSMLCPVRLVTHLAEDV